MLYIEVPKQECYDEESNEFKTIGPVTLQLEHSLLSISKWESKWHKPYFKKENKTNEQLEHYIKCMTINQHVDDIVYRLLTNDDVRKISKYIEDPMTATTTPKDTSAPSRELVTSELIYYWIVEHGIDFQVQKWHINRLFKLIEVCNVKRSKPKKRSKAEIMARNRALNEERRKLYNTTG